MATANISPEGIHFLSMLPSMLKDRRYLRNCLPCATDKIKYIKYWQCIRCSKLSVEKLEAISDEIRIANLKLAKDEYETGPWLEM